MDVLLSLLDPSGVPTPTLVAVAPVLVVLAASGVLYALTVAPRRPVEEWADPGFNPALDRSEARLRAVLAAEAEDGTDGLTVPPPGWWKR